MMKLMGSRPTKWEIMFRSRAASFVSGYEKGASEMSEYLRQMIIYNLINDAVISTNLDTDTVEHIVQIIEET